MRGLAGAALCCNKTIFGKLGRIFGGTMRAAVLIKVWRGCVGAIGSVKIRWREWNASAPSRGSGLATSPRGLGVAGLGARTEESFSGGKSLIGPDQVSWKFSNAGFFLGLAGRSGQGANRKTRCHRAAVIRVARGMRPSIKQSRKNSPPINFFGPAGPVTRARMLLPILWWKLFQRISNCGSLTKGTDGANGDTSGATNAPCGPKRLNELLAWPNDMQSRL